MKRNTLTFQSLQKVVLFIALILFSIQTNAQRKVIDSLLAHIKKAADSSKAMIYCQLGKEYVAISGDTSVLYTNKAIALAIKQQDKKTESDGYSLLGKTERNRGNYEKALSYHFKSLEIKERLLSDPTLASAYNDIGIVYKKLKRFDDALVYYKKANERAKKDGNKKFISLSYNNIGTIFIAKEIWDSALISYRLALDVARNINDTRALATVLVNIGDVYRANKKFKEAIEVYKEALQYDKANEDKYGITMSYLHIGRLLLEMKDYRQATLYLDSADKLSAAEGLRRERMDILGVRSNLEDGKGNHAQALHYLRQLLNLKDSILNEETAKQVSELKTRYETEKKEQQINLQQSEIGRKNYVIAGISSILLLGTLLGFSSYRRYRLRQQARIQNEIIKQQELATKAVIEAEEKERKRIAGDLHDGVGQIMSAASLNLSAVAKELEFVSDEQKQAFEKAASLVDEGCKEIRTVSHNIMPNALLKAGLASAIREFIDKIDHRIIKVNLYAEGFNERLASNIETVLYRVVQECVNNVIKHSGANKLDITLIKDEEGISVTVEDNGKGFNAADKSKFDGIGLKNIQTRIEYLKGSVEWDSAPNKGTVVAIQIPV